MFEIESIAFNFLIFVCFREIVFPNGVLLSLDAPKLMFYKTQKFVKVVTFWTLTWCQKLTTYLQMSIKYLSNNHWALYT